MEALTPSLDHAALQDPDSSLPSLFPYDNFPIPKALVSHSNSSKSISSASGGEKEGQREEKGLRGSREREMESKTRATGLPTLAPALPISDMAMGSRSSSSESSPCSSPPRSRKYKSTAVEMRQLAKQQRLRTARDDELPSQRASRSTIHSFTSTGESVYEDAIEPDSDYVSDCVEELADGVTESQTLTLAPLESEDLSDEPNDSLDVTETSRSRQITPKATPQTTAPLSPFTENIHLSPESIATALDEQTFYLQRQASLQAEARRRNSVRQSISSLPTSPSGSATTIPFRRHSGVPRSYTPTSTSHPRRASVALSVSPGSGNRVWHPKPLVLTPVRTLVTPLTTDSSLSTSPRRRLSTYEGLLTGPSRSLSRASSLADESTRAASPLSPGGNPNSRSISPMQASPRRTSLGPNHPRRRSIGYIDTSNDLLSSFGRRAMGHDRRGRSASEDTGHTRSTAGSAITRFTSEGESPESSLSGWSDMGKRSPLLSDREWEQQWQQQQRWSGTPLEMVHEMSSGDVRPPDIAEEQEETSFGESHGRQRTTSGGSQLKGLLLSHLVSADAPSVHSRTNSDRPSTAPSSSHSVSIAAFPSTPDRPLSAAAAISRQYSQHRRESIPPTPPPKAPLPRPPTETQSKAPTKKRSRSRFDEDGHGHTLPVEPSPSNSDVGDDYSDQPISPARSSFSDVRDGYPSSRPEALPSGLPSPRSRRPIHIKSATARSAAATARRSARLSKADPPLDSESFPLERQPPYSSERRILSEDINGPIPLATLEETDQPSIVDEPRPSTHRTRSREPTHSSYASTTRASVATMYRPGSVAAGRRFGFEPRDPRTREELDAGQGSYLEVLFNVEPPAPRAPSRAATANDRWSTVTDHAKTAPPPLIRADSPVELPLSPKTKSNGFAHKFFGSLRSKPQPVDRSAPKVTKRPIVIPPQGSTRGVTVTPKPRPIVSGPLELQNAELAQQRSTSSLGTAATSIPDTSSQSLSVKFAPPIPMMQSFTSLSRFYDEQSDSRTLAHSDSCASFDTIDRRPLPKAYELPPGLKESTSKRGLAPAPPVLPIKPARSPLRPAPNSGNEVRTTAKPRSSSPVQSFKSINSHRPSLDSNTTRSMSSRRQSALMGREPSLNDPIGVRDVLRGQFLER